MQQLDTFLEARAATLRLVEDLDQSDLDLAPGPKKWSVGEVIDHLTKVDAIYRGEFEELIRRAEAGEKPYLERGFKDIDVSVFGLPKALLPWVEVPFKISSRFLPRAVGEFMIKSRFIPIENPEKATPVAGRAKAQLLEELRNSTALFSELFGAHPQIEFRALIHRHPLFGINSVPQMLEVLTGHEQRHQAQINDARTSALHKAGRVNQGV